jgi:hypothetical protein
MKYPDTLMTHYHQQNEQTLTSNHWTQKRPRHMMLEIQVLACDKHKNVAGLNRLIGPQASLFWYLEYWILLFVGTSFHGFYKMHWSMVSWIRCFKHYRQQSMGKLYFVGFLFSWFKWTMKSTKMRSPQIKVFSICTVICNFTTYYISNMV